VPRRIDQVEIVVLATPVSIREGHGLALDRDAPFPFQVHGVQDLVPEFPFADQAGILNKTISQGGFTVIDVSDDAEISYLSHVR